MRRHQDQIRAKGAHIVAIGTGNPEYAKDFIKEQDIDFQVLIDADRVAAKLSEVRRGTRSQLLGPKQILKGTSAFFKGNRQKKLGARPDQLGATFVIGTDGDLKFEHRAESADQHAAIPDVLAAL